MMNINKFKFNLQLFAGEKTERATPKRREEARKKGQVAKSNEIVTVLVLTATFLVLQAWVPSMGRQFKSLFAQIITYTQADLTIERASRLIVDTLLLTAMMVAPVLAAAVVAGYLANVLQIGFLFTTEPLTLKLNRLNPLNGFKRIFSKRAIAELCKSILKTVLVGYVAFSYLWKQLPVISLLMDSPVDSALSAIGEITYTASWRVIIILFILAAADYLYQTFEYEESLKMSKQEIKEEYKNIEGDPQLKAKIRERQRALAARRMMQEVPKATVVITNPTHIAVALRYEEGMEAPLVIAKGQDFIAERIREIAAQNNIPLVDNKNLARILYKKVEIGGTIPAELFQAVAEVLAYVYRLKKRY